MGQRMNIEGENLLYIFINGLSPDTKLHLSIDNPPQNLNDALNRAKTFQAVTRMVPKPINSLSTEILDERENDFPSTTFTEKSFSDNSRNRFNFIENQLHNLGEKVDRLNSRQDVQTSPTYFLTSYPFNPGIPSNSQLSPQINPTAVFPQANFVNNDTTNSDSDNNHHNNNNNNNYDNNVGSDNCHPYSNCVNPQTSLTPNCNVATSPAETLILPFDDKTMTAFAYINDKLCHTIFNTGSPISLISKKCFDYLKLNDDIEPPQHHRIFAVDDTPVKISGHVNVLLKFSKVDYPVTLLVVETSTFDIILGRDWMNTNISTINYNDHVVEIFPPSEKIEQSSKVPKDNISLTGSLERQMEIPNPPEYLAEALARAKTFEAVIKPVDSIKSLHKHIRDDTQHSSAIIINHDMEAINTNLEEKQLSQLNSQVPPVQKIDENIPLKVPLVSSNSMASVIPPFQPETFSDHQNFLPNTTNQDFDLNYQKQDGDFDNNKYFDYTPNCCKIGENKSQFTGNSNPNEKDIHGNLVVDSKRTLKGFLTEDFILLPHSEKTLFLKTEEIFEQNQFQLKGNRVLTSEKNVIVYDDAYVTITSQGIPCKISNFTSNKVTLGIHTHIAWLKPLIESASIPVCSTINNPLMCDYKLSKLAHRNKVLNDVGQWFQTTKMEAVLDNCINIPVIDTVPLNNLSSSKTQISTGNVPLEKKDTQTINVSTEDGDSNIHKIGLNSENSSKIQVPQGILEVPVNITCNFCVEDKTGNVPLLPKIYPVRRNSFFLNPFAHFVLLSFLTLSISQLGYSIPCLLYTSDAADE